MSCPLTSCCSHMPLIGPWGQARHSSWLSVIEFLSYLQEFWRRQRTNQILPVSGGRGPCRGPSYTQHLPSSWTWPGSQWIIWQRTPPKTRQWPTVIRDGPDSRTTLRPTRPLSLSSSLIPCYPLRFWDVLFSTNLSEPPTPVAGGPVERHADQRWVFDRVGLARLHRASMIRAHAASPSSICSQ